MKLTVLGGGQLGRMLGLAAVPLGVDLSFVDPSERAGAAAVGELVVGALDDSSTIARAARGAAAITYEWEGVPALALEPFVATHHVSPPLRALAVSQDRVAEKSLAAALGIGTAPWRAVDDRAGLTTAIDELGAPALLKTRSGGYDGKGQHRITDPSSASLDAAWAELAAGAPLILEGWVTFARELSVIAVRGRDGATAVWPIAENQHDDGILRVSRVRALDDPEQSAADALARRLLDELDYVGVLCIELFDTNDGLLLNEIAPRVHNSGHWTIEGAVTSQFENHVRAVLGLPLGATERVAGPAVMLNCIGRMPDPAEILAIPGAHLHDYGKSPRRARKVGHVTLVAPDEQVLEDRLVAARAAIHDDG
jgi:5-(carboxyamino)imidazole ribonucleotide synthase